MKRSGYDYDVVIIGAGIGGVVCGTALARAGMRVLILEQHRIAGGYCTSFRRGDFVFDAAAHSFGSYREDGNMRMVLRYIGLEDRVKINRYEPSDTIVFPDGMVSFYSNVQRTIEELSETFPEEHKNIREFFNFLLTATPVQFASLRKKTLANLLNEYFKSERLKSVLALPVLGNGALPPSQISAFTGTRILREFILDGGYYPEGCMQSLTDSIVERFKHYGGQISLRSLVKRILVKNGKVEGVRLDGAGIVTSPYVVCNCDARQVFLKLLPRGAIQKALVEKIRSMVPSLSTFILYLGIDRTFQGLPPAGTNIWFLPYYDLERAYNFLKRSDLQKARGFMVRLSPDKRTILGFVNAAYRSKAYWQKNKRYHMEEFINRIQNSVIPSLGQYVKYRDAATPLTLYRYTLNYKGAAYGWASTPQQLFTPELRQKTPVQGLYLAGHWTAQTQGIPGAAYIGLDTARLILKKEKKIGVKYRI